MQSNTRFYVLVAVVVVLLAGGWYFIRRETPSTEPLALPSQPSVAAKETPAEPLAAPDERAVTKPKRLEPAGAIRSNEEPASKPALTGDGKITGSAKNSSGQPVAGATVRLLVVSWKSFEPRPDDAAPLETQTGTDGTFAFTKLPVKTGYAVTAELGPLFAVDSTYIGERSMTAEVELSMMSTSFIAGTVVDADGAPVPRAALYAAAWKDQSDDLPFNETEITREVTDETGAFRFGHVPMGKFKMLVKYPGYAPLLSDWVLSGTENAQFVLKPGGSIAGRVVNAQTRQPVGKVSVTARTEISREEQRIESAADGAFAFENLRDTSFKLSVESDTLTLAKEPAPIKLAPTQVIGGIELEVDQGGTLSGSVRDAKSSKGIRSARLQLYETTNGRISKDAETDEDGAYSFGGLPTGNYSVYVSQSEGYVSEDYEKRQVVSVTAGQAVNDINFTLDSGTSVSGKVVDDTGAPVAQASVGAFQSRRGRYASAETDLNGLFTVVGVSADTDIFVRAQKKGLVAAPAGPFDLTAAPAESVTITMIKESTISGTVVDDAGKPVPRAEIVARKVGGDQRFGSPVERADMTGAFTLHELTEGDYRLQAQSGNRGYWQDAGGGDAIHLAAGESKTGVKLVVGDVGGLSISGRVTGEDGKPVNRAQVWANGPGAYGNAQTDSDGKYKISGLKEGSYNVGVQAQGHTSANVPSIAAGSENADFVLKGTGTIEGKVLDAASGQPVADFEVLYAANAPMDPRYFSHMGPGARTHSADGAFKVENVEAGLATLRVTGKGYAPKMHQVTDVVPGKTNSGIVIKLEAGATVEGRVVDSAGTPIAGAQVFEGPPPVADWERERLLRATSSSDGAFTLGGLAGGTATVSAYRSGYAGGSAKVQVRAGQTAHADIVLGAGGTVRIRVTENGAPSAGAYAGISTETGGGSSEQPDANGVVEIKSVAAGNYRAYAGLRDPSGNGMSNRNQTKPVSVTENSVTEVAFDFAAGTAALAGTVTFGAQPPSQAYATLTVTNSAGGGEEVSHVQIDAGGQFRMENLPPGEARLTVTGMTSELSQVARNVALELTDGQSTDVTVDLGGGGSVTGTVAGLTANGAGTSLALVQGSVSMPERATNQERNQLMSQMFSSGAYAGGTRIDPTTGTFTIANVQAGSYTLVATAIDPYGGARCATAPVTVTEGETVTVNLTLPR